MSDVQRQDCEGKGALIAWRAKVGTDGSGERAVRLETERQGIVALITWELTGAWAACGAFEWIALGYLAFSCVLIAVFAENLAHPVKLIGAQAFVAAVILVLCRVETRAARWRAWNKEKQRGTDRNVCPTVAQKFWHFWRHWYPHLFFLFCFEEMAKLVHLFSPGWQDAKLIAFDQWLTGVNPTLWLGHFARPASLRTSPLEDVSDAEQGALGRYSRHNLQTNRQSSACEATRNRQGRCASEIRRAIVTQQEGARRIVMCSDAGGFLIQERRLNRRSRNNDCIDVRLGEREMQLLDELFLNLQCLQEVHSGYLGSHLQA